MPTTDRNRADPNWNGWSAFDKFDREAHGEPRWLPRVVGFGDVLSLLLLALLLLALFAPIAFLAFTLFQTLLGFGG